MNIDQLPARVRNPLPTKEQIALICDTDALADLIDEVGRRIAKIETDLEFGDGDDDWAFRARNALALHRHCERMLDKRLKALSRQTPFQKIAAVKTSVRRRSECSPESLAILDGAFPDPAALEGPEELEEAISRLMRQMTALKDDRDDEILNFDQGERDEVWLARVAVTLRRAGAVHQELARKAAGRLQALLQLDDSTVEAMARKIAEQLGYGFDSAFTTKAEWTAARGEKNGRYADINEPFQGDYIDAAKAAAETLINNILGENDNG